MNRVYGKYRGTVVGYETDPPTRGRLKVLVPEVLEQVEVWAMPCVPYAGKQLGWFFLPPLQAGVWVEFEGGNVNLPIWTGCYWEEGELPVEVTASSTMVLRTKALSLTINDTADGSVTLNIFKNDQQISIVAKTDGLTCTVANGAKQTMTKAAITLAVGSDGASLALAAGSGTLKQSAAKVVVASGKVSINDSALQVGA